MGILELGRLAMQALWAQDEASFVGEHVQLSPSWSWPKPVQRGADGAIQGIIPAKIVNKIIETNGGKDT